MVVAVMKIFSLCMFACVVFAFSAFAGDITTVKMVAPGDKGNFAWPVLASYATPDILGC